MTVHIAPDGSGDYASLEAAVSAVPPWSTLMLDPGSHRLGGPLDIDKPLQLVGAGMDETEIASEAEGYLVRFTGDGPFGVREVTFRHEGEGTADVAVVEDGEVDIYRCRFTGGRWSEQEGRGGNGLLLRGSTVGYVHQCRVEGNQLRGIFIHDQAQPVLEGNVCSHNDAIGIAYAGSSGGTARHNECSQNGLHGISIDDQAQPTLEENACTGNGEAGIVFFDSSSGTALGNNCTENGYHGIAVNDQARPMLEANVCVHNGETGIRYAGSSGGTASQNECSHNGMVGIIVREEAQPTLEGNVCTDNDTVGIAYFGQTGGVARGNECTENGYDGIGVLEQAEPILEENTCADNGEVGIRFADTSGGVVRHNECWGNRWGIFVAETAHPDLADNDCYDNAEMNILDRRPSSTPAEPALTPDDIMGKSAARMSEVTSAFINFEQNVGGEFIRGGWGDVELPDRAQFEVAEEGGDLVETIVIGSTGYWRDDAAPGGWNLGPVAPLTSNPANWVLLSLHYADPILLGDEAISGVDCYHLQFAVDFGSEFLASGGGIGEAWISKADYALLQAVYTLEYQSSRDSGSMELAIELSQLGQAVAIVPPK